MKHQPGPTAADPEIALYFHWPFCLAKCPYCDFNSHVQRSIDHKSWAAAYLREILQWREMTGHRRVTSIYFGGGTPSLMDPATVDEILSGVRRAWSLVNNPEITLEANPTSVERQKLQDFAQAGINRVSMGVQALDDKALRLLGRQHDVADALAAWDCVASTFPRASFDLIYARQHQSLADWKQELSQALALDPSHLSLYQLTIEDGTSFGDRYKLGKLGGLPDDDASADLYLVTQDLCHAAGLPAYEISNHAKPGEESRHNLAYWRYREYVGIGPGAHGRVVVNNTRLATVATRAPMRWLAEAEREISRISNAEPLSQSDVSVEFLLMGLRMVEGVDLSTLETLDAPRPSQAAISSLIDQGLLWRDGTRIGTTDQGRQLLNSVLVELLRESAD